MKTRRKRDKPLSARGDPLTEISTAGGRSLSPDLWSVLQVWLTAEGPPKDLPGMVGQQKTAHWQRISRLATELIEAIEGPKGRKLAAKYMVRPSVAAQSKQTTSNSLGADISETPVWWEAVRELLASIAKEAKAEGLREKELSAQIGRGGKAKTIRDIADEAFAQIYELAGKDARDRGECPPDEYQKFRRALAHHLPSHLQPITSEAFVQRPQRAEKRRASKRR